MPEHKKQQQPVVKYLKEYSRVPTYIMIAAICIGIVFRFSSVMPNYFNQAEPAASEKLEQIQQVQQDQLKEDEAVLEDDYRQVVERFIENIESQDIEQVVSDSYRSVLVEKLDSEFSSQITNAEIEKVLQPYRGIHIYYFLLVTKKENVTIIVEMTGKRISNLYVEGWSEIKEDKEKYEDLLEQLKIDGEPLN